MSEKEESWWCIPAWKIESSRPKSQCFSSILKTGKRPMSQLKEVSQEEFPFSSRRNVNFVLFRPSRDWMTITHIREGNLVYCLLIQMLISPRNTDTPRIMFNQVYGHPLAQPSWHKISHHIIFHLTLIPITNGYCLVISFTWSDV